MEGGGGEFGKTTGDDIDGGGGRREAPLAMKLKPDL